MITRYHLKFTFKGSSCIKVGKHCRCYIARVFFQKDFFLEPNELDSIFSKNCKGMCCVLLLSLPFVFVLF